MLWCHHSQPELQLSMSTQVMAVVSPWPSGGPWYPVVMKHSLYITYRTYFAVASLVEALSRLVFRVF